MFHFGVLQAIIFFCSSAIFLGIVAFFRLRLEDGVAPSKRQQRLFIAALICVAVSTASLIYVLTLL
jgi:hypothetical protein